MPNEIFCLGLNSGEIAVYAYLMSCENRETYQCYPSYTTIGKALKMSKKTVMKYVKSLEEKCFITILRQRLDNLDKDYALLKMQAQELIVRNNNSQISMPLVA